MKHTEERVIAQLRQKHDVKVDTQNRIVHVLNGSSPKQQFKLLHDLGIKAWGKIDFLVNHCRYKFVRAAEF